MCYRLIDAKKSQHPVSLLCGVLGVSRAGYYAWKDRPISPRERRDHELLDRIRTISDESKGTYGWPRIHAEPLTWRDGASVLVEVQLTVAADEQRQPPRGSWRVLLTPASGACAIASKR